MSWPDAPRLIRLAAALALAGLTAGCFQPLYGEHTTAAGTPSVLQALRGVDVKPVSTPNGTRLARVGVEMRNQLLYDLTGGSGAAAPTHRLVVQLSSSQTQVIVDINSARADIQNYGIDATYTLTDLSTGKDVVKGQTFSRVSYDIPGQQQRFAAERGLRDAEDRAAKVIADNIQSRLASYFVAGS